RADDPDLGARAAGVLAFGARRRAPRRSARGRPGARAVVLGPARVALEGRPLGTDAGGGSRSSALGLGARAVAHGRIARPATLVLRLTPAARAHEPLGDGAAGRRRARRDDFDWTEARLRLRAYGVHRR